MGLRTHPDFLERLVGGFGQGRSCGELMGDTLVQAQQEDCHLWGAAFMPLL